MPETGRLAHEIVDVGRHLHAAGLIGGRAGNFSVLMGPQRILITPAGAHKGTLTEDVLLQLPLDASPEEAAAASSEFPLHRAAYRAHEDVRAVVHSHSPCLIACGLRNLTIEDHLPEVSLATAAIVTIPLFDSGSEALGQAVGTAVASGAGVVLLRNHGAVSVGVDVAEAAYRMELAELAAYAVLMGVEGGGAVLAERVQRLVMER